MYQNVVNLNRVLYQITYWNWHCCLHFEDLFLWKHYFKNHELRTYILHFDGLTISVYKQQQNYFVCWCLTSHMYGLTGKE